MMQMRRPNDRHKNSIESTRPKATTHEEEEQEDRRTGGGRGGRSGTKGGGRKRSREEEEEEEDDVEDKFLFTAFQKIREEQHCEHLAECADP